MHAGHHYLFCIICSPSGSYYAEGINPVKIMIESRDVRAVRGGTGFAKCGGNYAASMRAGEEAEKKGFSQVLWLDGVEMKVHRRSRRDERHVQDRRQDRHPGYFRRNGPARPSLARAASRSVKDWGLRGRGAQALR